MAVGHFKLDGREYMLPNQGALTRSNANQVAAKIGSGAGDYDDLQDWNAWLMDEWRAGVGKKDPETDGFLFATADTRFKQQIFLSSAARYSSVYGEAATTAAYSAVIVYPGGTEEIVTIGSGETYSKLAFKFTLTVGEVFQYAQILLDSSGAVNVTARIYNDSSGPNSVVESVTITPSGEIGYHWYHVEFTPITAAGTEVYYLSIEPASGTMDVPTTNDTHANNFSYNGATWSSGTTGYIGFVWNDTPTTSITNHARYGGWDFYSIGAKVYIETVGLQLTGGATVTDLMALGDTLYVGLGDSTNYYRITDNFPSWTNTAGSVPGRIFTMHNGYLWRAVGGSVYYTSDESTWTEIVVADSGYTVTGMAGLGVDLIVSTNNALYRIVPGDVVYSITGFGTPSSSNGVSMVNFQGQLYIPLGESIVRFDGETMLPFGLDLDEGLPEDFVGNVVGLTTTNQWLLCAVAGGECSTIWAHNGQGWHTVCRLPNGLTVSMLNAGQQSNNIVILEIGTEEGMLFNPYIANTPRWLKGDTVALTYQHHFTGWLETNWFYGSLREVEKDFESVYIDGENISATSYIDVYWQDDDSTNWEYLGQVTASTQELRWSNYANRPSTKRIKIGISLHNSFLFASPIVTAIRIKYMPMIRDRWRWQIPVWVSNNQQMVDGDINPYNAAQMRLHLDALTKQVPPFIFEDPEGTQYEVKIMNASQQLTRVDWMQETLSFDTQYVYNLVVEQVIADEYSA